MLDDSTAQNKVIRRWLLLKEIVVVVDETKYYFKGKDLTVINTVTTNNIELLIINDENKNIAVFQKWDLWRELPEG